MYSGTLGFLTIIILLSAPNLLLAQSTVCSGSNPSGCCPDNPFLPCAPPGALSPDDAQYRFMGVVSGLPGSSIPQEVLDDLDVLSSDDSTFTRMSFEVRFLRNMASECRIQSDWSLTSVISTDPQCSLTDACSSTYESCAGVEPAESAIDLRIGNVRWSQPIQSTYSTMAFEKMQFFREKRFTAPNDDAEDDRQPSFCSQEHDDMDCNCCDASSGYNDCTDEDNNADDDPGQCPSICDDDSCGSNPSATTEMCTPNGSGVGKKTYMYAWGHKYSSGASTDYTCSDGNDYSDGACNSANTLLCDRSLHPTTAFGSAAFGALPVQMIDAYAQGLVYDGCQLTGVCNFNGNGVSNWSKKPSSFSDDVDDAGSCTNSLDMVQRIDESALSGLVDYQIRTSTYQQIVSDVDEDNGGVYMKDTEKDNDQVLSFTCGYCEPDGSNSNLNARRYFQYQMTPTCTTYQLQDPSSIVPVWDGSFEVQAGNFVVDVEPDLELGANTQLVTSSDSLDLSVLIQLDEALVLSPPSGVTGNQYEYLVSCVPNGLSGQVLASDVDYNFPYLNGDRFPNGPCVGCTPAQQSGLDSQRLWYMLNEASARGLSLNCQSGQNAASSFASGGMSNVHNFYVTEPSVQPGDVYAYQVCEESDQRFCRPLYLLQDNVGGFLGPGFTAAPSYVIAQFERFSNDRETWVANGSTPADEPIWSDYEASYFMPPGHTPADPAPPIWAYLGDRYPGPGIMFVEPDDGDAEEERPSFRMDVYIRDSLAGAGGQYLQATLNMQSTNRPNLCPALNPADLCDADALSLYGTDTSSILEACGYTVFSTVFTFQPGQTTATVRLNLSACEDQGFLPFCLADGTECQQLTAVNGVTIPDSLAGSFQNVEIYFDATALANCNSPCQAVVEQCLAPDFSGPFPCTDDEWHAVSDPSSVQSCSDTVEDIGDAPTGPSGETICDRSASRTPSITPSASITPSITPSTGSTPSPSTTKTPVAPSPSKSLTPSPTTSLIITISATPTPYYDPYYYDGNPDPCGWFCDLGCVCSDGTTAQCILAPCLLLAYLGVFACILGIAIAICVGIRQAKKKDAKDSLEGTAVL